MSSEMTDVLAVVLIFVGLLICYIGIRVYHLLNAKGRAKDLSIQVIAKATKRTYFTAAWRLTENGYQLLVYVDSIRGYEWWPIEYFTAQRTIIDAIERTQTTE